MSTGDSEEVAGRFDVGGIDVAFRARREPARRPAPVPPLRRGASVVLAAADALRVIERVGGGWVREDVIPWI